MTKEKLITFLVDHFCNSCPNSHSYRLKAKNITAAINKAVHDPYTSKVISVREVGETR